MSLAIELAERRVLPDRLVRYGIRRLLADRLRQESAGGTEAARQRRAEFLALLAASPIAVETASANAQHYEVPAEFFAQMLGPRMKYSCCYWRPGAQSLADAEEAMLRLTCERANLADGQDILELGCGWGSLCLYAAERFPHSRIMAVSNSASQREFIERRAQAQGLTNLQVVTCDINDFQPSGRFDRIVSIEMFEHLRNYAEMFRRVSLWLRLEGQLFLHIFCHRMFAYPFTTDQPDDWMGRHFFTGGIMPADDLLDDFTEHLHVTQRWQVDGTHYARTLEAWLAQLDPQTAAALAVLPGKTTTERRKALARWRMFLMACAELFGYRDGQEWRVGHFLLRR